MDSSKYLLSICIMSYNRPEALERLLNSVDAKKYEKELEIVICEDKSPRREEIGVVAHKYASSSKYDVVYVENEVNLGFGKNWRQCAHKAHGEYLLYMGDDDRFVPGSLDLFMDWVSEHNNLGYILRTYQTLQNDGTAVINRYYSKDKFYERGIEGYVDFFLKSNFMSGYTVKREYTFDYEDDALDYTLYYQMYLMGEICLKYPSGYCTLPITEYVGDGISMFGASESEKDYFKPGVNPAADVRNVQKTFDVCEYIDKKYGIDSTTLIKKEFAKYNSYPTMLRCRRAGVKSLKECRRVLKEMKLDDSKYFNVYYYALLFLGVGFCEKLIKLYKKTYGGRPEL